MNEQDIREIARDEILNALKPIILAACDVLAGLDDLDMGPFVESLIGDARNA